MNGLLYIRKLNNMSLETLSKNLGVSNQFISMWETGKKHMPSKYLQRLSEIFGVDEKYFGDINEIEALEIQNQKLRHEIAKTEYHYDDVVYDDVRDDYVEVTRVGYDQSLDELVQYNNTEIKRKKMLMAAQRVSAHTADDDSSFVSKQNMIINLLERYINLLEDDSIPLAMIDNVIRAFELSYKRLDDWGDWESGSECIRSLRAIIDKNTKDHAVESIQ